MKKGKSITLLTLILVILVLLITATFVSFTIPFYKNGTYNYNSLISILNTDCDVSECYVYDLEMKNNLSLEEDVADVDSALSIIDARLVELGYKNYSVVANKADGTDDYDVRIVITPNYYSGTLSERLSLTTSDIDAVVGFGELKFTDANGTELFGSEEVVDTSTYQTYDTQSEEAKVVYCCNIKFTEKAVNILKNAQGSEEKMTLNIKLGDEELFSDSEFKVANVKDNQIAISGYSTMEQAKQKALQIKTAGLMYEYEVSEPKVVTPTLGQNIQLLSIITIVVAIVVIIGLAIFKFRGFALPVFISMLALLFLNVFFFIAIPGISLSIASVIGVLLSILITAYLLHNYLTKIYAEFDGGKTLKAAINVAGKRTLLTYIDFGVVAEIILIALIIFANGIVKDLAIALGIGIALSIFISVLFTQWLIKLIYPLVKNKTKFFNLSREDK